MAEMVSTIAPALQAEGFRKRRHAFNRAAGDGIVHVIHFQMGAFQPPGTPEIPYWRPSRYGRFTINLGVHSPGLELHQRRTGWVNEYDCQLRRRVGGLLPGGRDRWWSLDDPGTGGAAANAIRQVCLPWLDRYRTTGDILDEYRARREEMGMAPNAPLSIASLLVSIGDRPAATAVFRDYVREEHPPAHWSFVEDVANRLELVEVLEQHRRHTTEEPMPEIPAKVVPIDPR
jgi:hypothetical protein